MKFLPYQVRWIQDESPIKLYEKTRRGGITYATSYRACVKCIRSGEKGSTFVQWVSSRDEITAKEFIVDYVAHWAREANKAAARAAAKKHTGFEDAIGLEGENLEIVDEKRGITARVVKFKNGARIYSLSSNPLAFAGKGGDVLIDEWDLHENQAAIYDMAFPCTTWGGQLELVSAYDSEGSEYTEFAQLCKKCKNGLKPNISFHRTTIEDAIADGFVETVNEVKLSRGQKPQTRDEFRAQIKEGCRTLEAYETQYMCKPNLASGEQMIDAENLTAAQKRLGIFWLNLEGMDQLEAQMDLFEATWWARLLGNDRYAVGWDIAATGDLTAICVNRLLPSLIPGKPMHEQAVVITMHRCDRLTRQRAVLAAILSSSYQIVGCGDRGGLGISDCTELELQFRIDDKRSRFQGINFSASKLTLGTVYQAAYQQGRHTIDIDHPEIAQDVASVKKDKTPTAQKLTFTAGKNELLEHSHADICWGDALAVYAGETLTGSGPARIDACGARVRDEAVRADGWNNSKRRIDDEIRETIWPC